MSSPARSLNARVPHRQLLDQLGCTVRTHSLPQLMVCPVCGKGGMQIYHDHIDNGAWYYCRVCNRYGDLLELAAETWQLELPQAITRLAGKGFDLPADKEAIQRYQREHVNYRQRLEKLWDDAQQGLIHRSHALMRVMQKLGLNWSESITRWQSGPGQLIGGIHKTEIEKCFAPTVMNNAAARNQKYNPSANATFKGKSWGDVLVVPFYDLPGRISCLLCVGREGDPAQDFVIKRTNRGCRGNQHVQEPFEAGLAFHPDLFDEAAYHDRTVIAVSNPVMALQLQFRQFSLSLRPLPMVTWLDSAMYPSWQSGRPTRTRHAWQMMVGYKVVFWMPKPHFDIHAMRQAIAVDGLVSRVGPREPGEQPLREYCWKRVPDELFQHIQEHAQPWQDVLSAELAKQSDAGVEQLLVELEQAGEDVEEIVNRCHHNVQTRVQELRCSCGQPRSITLNGRQIVEMNDEWHIVSRKHQRTELIVDAVLKLDAGVIHRRLDKPFYRGRILYRGQEVRFFEPMDRIDENPLEFMRACLLEENIGMPTYNPSWKNRIVRVAEMFHQPTCDKAVDTVGWDGETDRFMLPNYSIALGGKVESIDFPLFADRVPGRELEQPETLSGEELDRPSASRELESLFWATSASIIANIIAPAVNEETRGICLDGPGAIVVGEAVTEAMGCLPLFVRGAKDVERALVEQHTHGFPVQFKVGYQLQRRHRRELFKGGDVWENCVVAVDPLTAGIMALRGGWNVIVGRQRVKVPDDVLEFAKKLLPAYLKHLCERRLELVAWEDSGWETLAERVIRDLARFCDEFGGTAGGVLSAGDVLLPDHGGHHPHVVADLLDQLIKERQLKIAPKPDGRGKPRLVEVPECDGLLLTHTDFKKLFRDVPVELPYLDDLGAILFAAGALVEPPESKEEFQFHRVWLTKRWQRTAMLDNGLVKLRG